jgi:chemotaxis protein MotA
MVVLGGLAIVMACVLIGFTMAGGHIGALIHPSEFITIGGASFGALVIMSPKRVLIDLFKSIPKVLKGTPYNKAMYTDLFGLLYSIARLVRRDGLIALDTHVSKPAESPVFQRYPRVTNNHHALEFMSTGLTQIVDGKVEAAKLMASFEDEMKVIDREHHQTVDVLAKTADGLPGFGIVAAVLGIVVTMQAIDGPASEIGHKVGAALVGTFLGILLSYGFFGPLAARMETLGASENTFFATIASAVLAINAGDNPKDVVLSARRLVDTDCRPTLNEMNDLFAAADAAAA